MAPKRPAESLARPNASSSSLAATQPSSSTGGKRVKFDAATLNATNSGGANASATEAELEEDDLLNPSTARKKVVTDGYDSDSSADGSEDGFGGVGGGRKGRKGTGAEKEKEGEGEGEDEDDDMFDGGHDEGEGVAKRNTAEKSKKKEFLEMGDIEGQEFGKGEDEEEGQEQDGAEEDEEEEYALEDDLANDDDAPRSRRSKKGMGYQLSSFNMADELNEGRFSADGTYVRNNDDPLATHDKWLDGVSKASIRAARESKKRMDEQARKKEEEEARGAEAMAQQRDDCLIGLLSLVRPGESITMALNRLGKRRRKVAKKVVRPKVRDGDEAMDLDEQTTTSSEVSKGKQREEEEAEDVDPAVKMIDRITYLASTLLAQGELEIYDTSYEAIIQTLKEEGAVRREWVPPVDPDIAKEEEEERLASLAQPRRGLIARPNVVTARPSSSTPQAVATAVNPNGRKFFYKWKVPQADQVPNQEYGPFGTEEIETWIQGGFLGPQGANIVVRVEGQGGQAWTNWQEAKV
ncbi:BQ5605_C003g02419 [Microbotryum silenes-dioicae]|uniref:BQ5605_C003g02419 protein n=1 Tax=Microbotryum silenes-dioicae TaxID=796604 RepID=A0A2X0MW34_9BASI|nr:BQ5605_C003g02419 [Microbotryum silenes-dioicae]